MPYPRFSQWELDDLREPRLQNFYRDMQQVAERRAYNKNGIYRPYRPSGVLPARPRPNERSGTPESPFLHPDPQLMSFYPPMCTRCEYAMPSNPMPCKGFTRLETQDDYMGIIAYLPAPEYIPRGSSAWGPSEEYRQTNLNDTAFKHPCVILFDNSEYSRNKCGHLVFCAPVSSFGHHSLQDKYKPASPLSRERVFAEYVALDRGDTERGPDLPAVIKHSGSPMPHQSYVHLDFGFWIEPEYLGSFDKNDDESDRRVPPGDLAFLRERYLEVENKYVWCGFRLKSHLFMNVPQPPEDNPVDDPPRRNSPESPSDRQRRPPGRSQEQSTPSPPVRHALPPRPRSSEPRHPSPRTPPSSQTTRGDAFRRPNRSNEHLPTGHRGNPRNQSSNNHTRRRSRDMDDSWRRGNSPGFDYGDADSRGQNRRRPDEDRSRSINGSGVNHRHAEQQSDRPDDRRRESQPHDARRAVRQDDRHRDDDRRRDSRRNDDKRGDYSRCFRPFDDRWSPRSNDRPIDAPHRQAQQQTR